MKKKVLSVLLSVAMVSTLFAGCGDSGSASASTDAGTSGTEAASAGSTADL